MRVFGAFGAKRQRTDFYTAQMPFDLPLHFHTLILNSSFSVLIEMFVTTISLLSFRLGPSHQ